MLIQHATLWDGVGERIEDVDVATAYGLIVKIGKGLTTNDVIKKANALSDGASSYSFLESDVVVWDVEGRVVSPGIVDMHSHVGTQSVPGFDAEQDTNEGEGGPLVPQLRILDAFNTLDPAISFILSGGVTTSLVIPGSGPLMGGEGVAIKMVSAASTSNNSISPSVDAFLLFKGVKDGNGKEGKELNEEEGEEKLWRWMKMACGENPKGGEWGEMPGSRMGSGWLVRERLESARALLRDQDDWCANAKALQSRYGSTAHLHVEYRYPNDLKHESLVALLRGQVKLQVHCYQVNDIDMMLRNQDEFGFDIAAFHHATEAHLLSDKLAAANISVALFADHSLYKREAYKHSVLAGQILSKAGVKIAYKSDHPVTNAQNLIYEAQKAVHYGLDPDIAFQAVTSVPAEKIGVGHRIGRVAEGFDADLVVWDRPPLQLGAHPLRIIIDGRPVFELPWVLSPPQPAPPTPQITPTLDQTTTLDSYTITNISKIYASETVLESDTITIENGIVSCIGPKCSKKGFVFNLNQGVVIPAFIAAAVPVGLQEIGQEDSTWDGIAGSEDAIEGYVYAKDGLRVGGGSKLQEYAWKSGVLTAISVPRGGGFVVGVSTAFRTGAELYRDAILVPDVGLHINLGHSAKESYAKSISAQFARLRSLLASPPPTSPFTQVLLGKLPLIVTVHDPNDISKLLNITSAYQPTLKLIIAGATGAWAVANEIAKAKAIVLLNPPRCQSYSWEQRWCKRVGDGGPSHYEILKGAGVSVLVSVKEADQVRSLWMEAGWATVGDSNGGKLDVLDAIGSVTWRVADAFGLGSGTGRVIVGERASFVGFNGGPVGFGFHVQVLGDGKDVTTLPKQD
ncbi:UNVERIFIED_CONTAM: hypothetical protein HDU68_002353 [Siphonaria sp. JEL0065]|nr:hypothetical protein HDU68_002353 [Siphonaria sp. JEL0065]